MANRTVLGRRGTTSDYGLFISAAGKDVLTITNLEDFLFNSTWASAATIHAQGTLTRGATATFAALPYVPLVLSWGIHKSTGRQEGRYNFNAGYFDGWWDPALSEMVGQWHYINVEGPQMTATTNSVTYLAPPTHYAWWNVPDNWNARYIVLRTDGGA